MRATGWLILAAALYWVAWFGVAAWGAGQAGDWWGAAHRAAGGLFVAGLWRCWSAGDGLIRAQRELLRLYHRRIYGEEADL